MLHDILNEKYPNGNLKDLSAIDERLKKNAEYLSSTLRLSLEKPKKKKKADHQVMDEPVHKVKRQKTQETKPTQQTQQLDKKDDDNENQGLLSTLLLSTKNNSKGTEELKKKLHERIQELRIKRKADKHVKQRQPKQKPQKEQPKQKNTTNDDKEGQDSNDTNKNSKKKKKSKKSKKTKEEIEDDEEIDSDDFEDEDNEMLSEDDMDEEEEEEEEEDNDLAVTVSSKRQKTISTADLDESDIMYSTFDFGTGQPLPTYLVQKRKYKKPEMLLKEIERKKMLAEKNPKLAEKFGWENAIKKAKGEKIRDDPRKLKKSIKRKQRQKKKSAVAWSKRLKQQEEERVQRDQQRKANIKEHLQKKKEKKMVSKKQNRAGFEGKRRDYINK